jgi:hypothetical protein
VVRWRPCVATLLQPRSGRVRNDVGLAIIRYQAPSQAHRGALARATVGERVGDQVSEWPRGGAWEGTTDGNIRVGEQVNQDVEDSRQSIQKDGRVLPPPSIMSA